MSSSDRKANEASSNTKIKIRISKFRYITLGMKTLLL